MPGIDLVQCFPSDGTDREKAKRYDNDLVVNQEVFSTIFSYLSEDDRYLKVRPDRTVEKLGIRFREGKIIRDLPEESALKE